MKTRHKIAIARAMYWGLSAAQRLRGRGDQANVRRGGVEWRLDLQEGIDLAIFLGVFERATVAAYRRLIEPGQTVIDIGANIGAHTLLLANAVGDAGRVFAFEPTDYGFCKMIANIEANPDLAKRIVAEQIMLGTADGEPPVREVYSSWPLVGGGESLHPLHLGVKRSTSGAVCRSLDSYVLERGIHDVRLIKLDVDGFECDVLAGAQGVLQRCRPTLIMEFAPYVLAERGATVSQLLALLAGYDFLDERRFQPISRSLLRRSGEVGSGMNIVAVPAQPQR